MQQAARLASHRSRVATTRGSGNARALRTVASRRYKHVVPLRAVLDGPGEDSNTDYAAVAASLNALLAKADKATITGKDLRALVVQKWGRSYDVRLCKLQGRMYLQVMWKFLEQRSFPLTEAEYMQQLDAVAEYLTDWGVVDTTLQRTAFGARV